MKNKNVDIRISIGHNRSFLPRHFMYPGQLLRVKMQATIVLLNMKFLLK